MTEAPATDFVALIPARLASTRLPNKPLLDIGGLPMVVRVAHQAQRSGARRVAVATDAPEVARAVQQAGIEVVITASTHTSGTDRLAEACEQLALSDMQIVVNVQGDEPLVPPALIKRVAQALADAPDLAMATAAHAIHHEAELTSRNVVKVVVDRRGRALYFSRAPIPCHRDGESALSKGLQAAAYPKRHIGLYAYRAAFLRQFCTLEPSPLEQLESLEQLRALWHGHGIAVVDCDEAPPPGVDTIDDLQRVRQLLDLAG